MNKHFKKAHAARAAVEEFMQLIDGNPVAVEAARRRILELGL